AGDALGAELRAVHGVAAGQLGDRPADDGAQTDEGRLVRDLLRLEDLGLERRDVLDVGRAVGAAVDPVHRAHVPAVGLVTCGGVLRERDRGVALDGDLVVVPQDDEVAQLLGAGDRAGLAAYALLEVAVGGDHVGEVVERAGARGGLGVQQAALAALRHREADRGGDALAQRAGGDLDAVGEEVLGMAGGLRPPGAQLLDVLLLEAEAAEEQLDVLGQARVAGGEHETVAAEPVLIARVVAHHVLVEQVCGGGEAHGGAGVAAAHLLDGVRGEDAGGVDRTLVEIGPALGGLEGFRHCRVIPFGGARPGGPLGSTGLAGCGPGLPRRRLERFTRRSRRAQEEGRWAVTATQGASVRNSGRNGGRAPRTAGSVLRGYVALTKPRIIELLLITTIPTMSLAAGGFPSPWLILTTMIGGYLAAGGANALNMYLDRDIDAKMKRTKNRPLVTGEISPRAGLVFGIVLSIVSTLWLGLLVNWMSAALGAGAILLYVVFYTILLKRRTSQNIVWGGVAGCMPVLIGWSAVTGTVSWTAVLLFLVIFFWTPPHYWPLAEKFSRDYADAGVPMLPVVASRGKV